MSQFFVKKGVITSEVGRTVKVSYRAKPDASKSEMAPAEKEEREPEVDREVLLAKRVYDFSEQLKTDEERLEEHLAQGRKKVSPEKPGAVLPDELSEIYHKAGRMLANLGGYKGGGLGAHNQGITEFIKPERRMKFGQKDGGEEKNNRHQKGNRAAKQLSDKEKQTLEAVHKWRKNYGGSTRPEGLEEEYSEESEGSRDSEEEAIQGLGKTSHDSYKKKVAFRPASDISLSMTTNNQKAGYKIVDMTKLQPSIHESMKEVTSSRPGSQSTARNNLPAARCNGRVLLERLRESHAVVTAAAKAREHKLKAAVKDIAAKENELFKCKHDLKTMNKKGSELGAIKNGLEKVESLDESPDSLNLIIREFTQLLNIDELLWQKYNLKLLLLKKITKIFSLHFRGEKNIFSRWVMDGISDTIEILEILHKVKPQDMLMSDTRDVDEIQQRDSFKYDIEYLVTRSILPGLTNYTANEWDHEDPHDLVELFLSLERIFPEQTFYDFFDSVISKTLIKKISGWQMDESMLYPHLWIQPWLPILARDPGHRIDAVFDKLKTKFRGILMAWSPEDKYAAKLLHPWKDLLPKPLWEDLLYLDILPKVIFNLESFEADPRRINVEPLTFFIEWSDFVPAELTDDLIREYISSKVEAVLANWQNADRAEVEEWTEGWLELFLGGSADLQDSVKEALMALIIKYCPQSR